MSSLSLLWISGICLGAEPVELPLELGTFKTLDNKVYEGAKVIGKDAVGIRIMHDGGTARITYERLPKELAEKFEVDPDAAKAQLAKEAAEGAAHDREADLVMKSQKPGGKADVKGEVVSKADEEEEPEAQVEAIPEMSEKAASERIVLLRQYIARQKVWVKKEEEEISRRMERASKMEANAGEDVHYNLDTKTMTTAKNRTSMGRAEFVRKMAEKQREKLNEVKQLIRKAEAEIMRLQ